MADPFDSMVSGIAATEDAVLDDLRADLQTEGSKIANTSPFSPFFRLMGAVFSGPVLYLRGLVIDTVLPGIFGHKATGTLLNLRAADLGETRKPASKAVGNITFSRTGTTGALPIPLGTAVESPPIDGVTYRVVTTAAGTILDGQSSALVPAEAESEGAAHNLGDEFYSVLPVPVAGVTGVSNAAGWLTTPGTDIEADADLQDRLVLKWKQQGSFHWTDTYRSILSEISGIEADNIYFDETAPRGAGSADAFLVTDSGLPSAALVQQADDEINLNKNHGLGDDLLVKAMPALNVDIDLTITADPNLTAGDKTQLGTDVENLIRAAFRETAAYPDVARVAPFERVSRSALAGEIHEEFGSKVEAVDWTAPVADPAPLMQLPVIRRASLDAGAVVDKGGGLVGLPAAAHGIPAATKIAVAGTVNYDGVTTVDAGSTANEIVIAAVYVAEALSGAETATALVVTVS